SRDQRLVYLTTQRSASPSFSGGNITKSVCFKPFASNCARSFRDNGHGNSPSSSSSARPRVTTTTSPLSLTKRETASIASTRISIGKGWIVYISSTKSNAPSHPRGGSKRFTTSNAISSLG